MLPSVVTLRTLVLAATVTLLTSAPGTSATGHDSAGLSAYLPEDLISKLGGHVLATQSPHNLRNLALIDRTTYRTLKPMLARDHAARVKATDVGKEVVDELGGLLARFSTAATDADKRTVSRNTEANITKLLDRLDQLAGHSHIKVPVTFTALEQAFGLRIFVPFVAMNPAEGASPGGVLNRLDFDPILLFTYVVCPSLKSATLESVTGVNEHVDILLMLEQAWLDAARQLSQDQLPLQCFFPDEGLDPQKFAQIIQIRVPYLQKYVKIA